MAKQRGAVASFYSGRLGNTVGAKFMGGDYVSRSYQPKVKNPNTYRQQISRAKMAKASQLAAGLSSALKIGYAMASASTKMYARNMFVKSIIPVDANIFTINDGEILTAMASLPVSRAAGIADKPVIVMETVEGTNNLKFTATNAASVVLEGGQTLGLVVVMLNQDGKFSIVKQSVATNDVVFTEEELSTFDNPHVYSFFKAIPVAKNGVADTTQPWMYPSETSACTHTAM